MKISSILTLLLINSFTTAHAVDKPAPALKAVDKVEFRRAYLRGLLAAEAKPAILENAEFHPRDCNGNSEDPSCVSVGCSMGAYDCKNYSSHLEKVASECNSVDGACVKDTCSAGAYDCKNYSSHLDKVLELCKDINSDCVKTVCSMGAYDCKNYSSHLDKAALLCKGWVKSSCIRDMCAMGSYDCRNYSSHLEKVAELCKNR